MIDDVSNGSRRAKRSKEDLLLGYFVFFLSLFLLLFLLFPSPFSSQFSRVDVTLDRVIAVHSAPQTAGAGAHRLSFCCCCCRARSRKVHWLVCTSWFPGRRQSTTHPSGAPQKQNKKTRNISQVCFFSKNTLVQYSSAREIYFSGPLAAVRLERNFERNIILQIICVGASYWAWWPCLFRHPPTKSSNRPNRLF